MERLFVLLVVSAGIASLVLIFILVFEH